MKKLREVLLVDDYDADNFLHRRVIEGMGVAHRVTECRNGKAALEYLQAAQAGAYPQPELILLDINMPVMNGWEFLEAYAALPDGQRGGTVVMMLTTSANPDDRAKAEGSGVVANYVAKPLDRDKLRAILEACFPGVLESS